MDVVPPAGAGGQVFQSLQSPNFSGVVQNLKQLDPDDPVDRNKIKGTLTVLESYALLIGGKFGSDFGLLKSNFDAGYYNSYKSDIKTLSHDKAQISDEDFLTGTISALNDLKKIASSNGGDLHDYLAAMKTIASPTYLWKGPLGDELSARDFTEPAIDTDAIQLKIQDLINQISS